SMFKGMRRGAGSEDEHWCWRRILIEAVTCRELALRARTCPGEQAFLAGLTQDVGLLLGVQQHPRVYHRVLRKFHEHAAPLAQIERAMLGRDHAAASASLLTAWTFPAAAIRAVADHHDRVLDPGRPAELADLLFVAETIADFLLTRVPA